MMNSSCFLFQGSNRMLVTDTSSYNNRLSRSTCFPQKALSIFERSFLKCMPHATVVQTIGHMSKHQFSISRLTCLIQRDSQNCPAVDYFLLRKCLNAFEYQESVLQAKKRRFSVSPSFSSLNPHQEKQSLIPFSHHPKTLKLESLLHTANDETACRVCLTLALFEQKCDPIFARQLFNRGLKINPGDTKLMQAWGLFESKMGNIVLARRLLERAVMLDLSKAPVLRWKQFFIDNNQMKTEFQAGLALLKERKFEKARRQLIRCVLYRPDCVQAWICLAYLELKRRQNAEQSRIYLTHGLLFSPANSQLLTAWAGIEGYAGQTHRAKVILHARKRCQSLCGNVPNQINIGKQCKIKLFHKNPFVK